MQCSYFIYMICQELSEKQHEVYCRSLGCLEPGCALCAQNPNRRCSTSFSSKYLAGDILKAKCNASIRIDIVSRATLEPAPQSVTQDIHLEVSHFFASYLFQSLQMPHCVGLILQREIFVSLNLEVVSHPSVLADVHPGWEGIYCPPRGRARAVCGRCGSLRRRGRYTD